MGVTFGTTVDDIKKHLLQSFGHRTARTGANTTIVEFADRGHFGGRAGEEGLVADVDLIAGDALLDQLQAQVLADREDGVAGDAVERAGRQVGRVDHAVLDDEEVLPGAFGNETVRVKKQRLVVAMFNQPIPRLVGELDRDAMLGHLHGQVWNAAEPARAMGVNESTVRRYLDVLTQLFLVRKLQPWYENLAKRTDLEGVKSVCVALQQAERYGTPVGQALRVMAKENRDARMAEAEKKAAALPPKLTVPMIVFFLPVLLAVVITPAAIQIVGLL